MAYSCEDAEPCEVVCVQIRTARKAHTCVSCGHHVVPGETYWHRSHLCLGRWGVEKQCERCGDLYESLLEAGWCSEPQSLWQSYRELRNQGWLEAKPTGGQNAASANSC